jgi:hypothetical protein
MRRLHRLRDDAFEIAAHRNNAATTSVEPAIARFDPPANDEKTACPASTSPAYAAPRITVSAP